MTLGGLALAVGILVDDATVAIENTYRLMEEGKPFRESVVQGASGIAKPALISTLAICSAFVSVFFLTDAPKFLFTPQAMAVVFAMLASYVLSRTLVPVLIDVLVKVEYDANHPDGDRSEPDRAEPRSDEDLQPASGMGRVWRRTKTAVGVPFRWVGGVLAKPYHAVSGWLRWGHDAFERGFARFRDGYIGLLHVVIGHRVVTFASVLGRLRSRRGAVRVRRSGLLPAGQRSQPDPAYPHPPGPADRSGRADLRQGRGSCKKRCSGQGILG